MFGKAQPFVVILLALFLGAISFTSLNNLNSLNELQQTLAMRSAPVLTQSVQSPAISNSASTEGNEQPDASDITTKSVSEESAQPQPSDYDLQIGNEEPLFLLRDVPTVTVSLAISPSTTITPSLMITLEMIVAQNIKEDALNVGYYSNVVSTTILPTDTTKILSLYFKDGSLPPTGRYLAQLIAHNENILVTKLVTLVVANAPAMTPQYRLSASTDDKRIVIAGSKILPCVTLLYLNLWCNEFEWNEGYEFLLWEKYLRPNNYHLMVSELADSVNGRTGRLTIITKTITASAPVSGSSVAVTPTTTPAATITATPTPTVTTTPTMTASIPMSVSINAPLGSVFNKTPVTVTPIIYTITVTTTITTPISVWLQPTGIYLPGSYTGTLAIVDDDDYSSMEIIPVVVHARYSSLNPFIFILSISFGIGALVRCVTKGSQDRIGWGEVSLWAVGAAVTGVVFIEARLPIFGNSIDYWAAAGWAFAVGTGPPAIKKISDQFKKV
jgi:hypothetical protein